MSDYAVIGHDIKTGKKITIGDIERRSALYFLGKPGMGKSALMVNLMIQDIEHGHGVFFLDPHTDAIDDLLHRAGYGSLFVFGKLFDPEDEKYSFGINLLTCEDVTSLTTRTDTYTRAYNVFYKLWEKEWGPWLQLILQNTLWAFIENQEYTLAEVPMFLNPRNTEFRSYILSNIKHNPAVVDFWQYEFFQRRERDQQERVDAALTRVTTLLTHPYIRHIIGQRQTTIDFNLIMRQPSILLFKLSANLAEDIKKFIGTILISELLHAVRNRPQNWREQFCIFVDEFQNFASSDDFKTLITEARKYGIASTFAHVERFGQFAENQKLLGATAAAVNKIFFQSTVKDAQELAPEFAQKPEETEARREAMLVISPHAVEDIWHNGHPNEYLTSIRDRYFWVVDLLKSNPQMPSFVFDPTKVTPENISGNKGKLHWSKFNDWDMYRSSAEMLKKGIALLNKYYYDWMSHKYLVRGHITDVELSLIFNVVECFSGVMGFRPTMEAYIPDEMRQLYLQRLDQKYDQELKNFIYRWEREGGKEAAGATMYPGRWAMNDQNQMWYRIRKDHPEWVTKWTIDDVPRVLYTSDDIQTWRSRALEVGLYQSELDQFIQWRIRPLSKPETEALTNLIKLVAEMQSSPQTYLSSQASVYKKYTAVMAAPQLAEKFGEDHSKLPENTVLPYLQTVTERIVWQ
jgi:hypothetical protein